MRRHHNTPAACTLEPRTHAAADESLSSRKYRCAALAIPVVLLLAACAGPPGPEAASAASAPSAALMAADARPLHSLAEFPIGVAVPAGSRPHSLLASPDRQAIVAWHFDALTAENAMKMKHLQPAPGKFTFRDADALVSWALARNLTVHGHTLVWHRSSPDWLTELEGSPEAIEAALTVHVRTVAQHYAGRVASWDVVNEAFTDQSPVSYRDTVWYRHLGSGYIERAFRETKAAAPEAELYYNDYNISGAIGPDKLDRILVMVDDFIATGVPINGIGFQMHVDMQRPRDRDMRRAFAKVAGRGLKVKITELDVRVNASEELTALDPSTAERQRARYAEIVQAYIETVPPELRGGITLWGVTDADSWIVARRKVRDWPLLFAEDFEPKPALAGFAEGLRNAGAPVERQR